MTVRVLLEPEDECILCLVCTAVCPEVFRLGRARIEYESSVSGDLEECARIAEENCPVDIIHVVAD
ncbi:MAG: ferredoxin [Desulfurococcales archaeon]|nr:ferredoxin [Desulfurococcales archaeon]